MTTAKRQTLADFMYYSLCAGQTKAGPYGYSPLPLNLVQAGFEQIAKLKAADPDGRPDRPRRALVQQPDVRRQEPRQERARPDRAAAGRLRQGRARARAAPTPAPTSRRTDDGSRRPTAAAPTAPAAAVRRRAAAAAPAAAPGRAGGDRAHRPPVDPETGAVVGGHAPRRHPATRSTPTRPSWPPTGPSTSRRSAGSPCSSCSRWCCCPACTSSPMRRRRRADGSAR